MRSHRARRAVGLAAVLAMGWAGGAVAGTNAASAGSADGDACGDLEPGGLAGLVAEPTLLELSGLAGSRRHQAVLWAHNDSGGAPELFAMREDGTSLGVYPIEGAAAVDWEDMAAGPGADGTGAYLYAGDIGDNDSVRPSVTVYRVPEPEAAPALPGAPLAGTEVIELTYPDGPSDAEALLVDPRTGDLVIVTKSLAGASRVLSAPVETLVPGAPVAMVDAGPRPVPLPPTEHEGLPATMVTGGDVSPDGSLIVLRTYGSVLVFPRADDESLAEALLGEPCFGPQQAEAQGEAIAFTGDGTAYVTASEGTNVAINRVVRTDQIVTTTTTATTASTGDDAVTEAAEDDDVVTIVGLLVGAALLLVVVGGVVLWWSRRRRGSGAG
jgi:hypothetical protein